MAPVPSTFCMYSDVSRKVPKSTAEAASIITKPPPTARSARRWIRSSGCAVRSLERGEGGQARGAAPPMPRSAVEAQPALAPARARTRAPEARGGQQRAAEVQASPRGRAGVGRHDLAVRRTASARPTGRLMKKIARQSTSSVSAPPSSTPTAAPAPPTAPQTPSAWRARGPREGGHDDRQRGRREHRRAEALAGAGGEQPAALPRERRGQRRDGEDGQAGRGTRGGARAGRRRDRRAAAGCRRSASSS